MRLVFWNGHWDGRSGKWCEYFSRATTVRRLSRTKWAVDYFAGHRVTRSISSMVVTADHVWMEAL